MSKPEAVNEAPKERLRFITKAAAAMVAGTLSMAACGGTESGPGYDIAHPQCGLESLPAARSFAIIGFNKGVPRSLNPCFDTQIAWAKDSAGDTVQPKASVYVVASNPGKSKSKYWPSSGKNVFGNCTGADTQACAYEYGKTLSTWNVTTYAKNGADNGWPKMKDIPWWIDVEVGTQWQCNQGLSALCGRKNVSTVERGAIGRNAAVIKGMASVLQELGIETGVYTNPRDWNLIAGNQGSNSNLHGIPVWINGARDKDQAIQLCNTENFSGLGNIVLSQYNTNYSKHLDRNVIC